MARAVVLLVLFSLAHQGVVGNDTLADQKAMATKVFTEMKEYAAREGNGVANDVRQAVDRLRTAVRQGTLQGKKDVEEVYERALVQYDASPSHCKALASRDHIVQLKSAGVSDFLHCPRLYEALSDVGQIIVDTVELAFQILHGVGDFFTGFAKCDSWLPWKLIPCYFKRIWSIYDDIKDTIGTIKAYVHTVTVLATNVSEAIAYCRNGSYDSSVLTAIMEPVHKCSGTPVQLYHLRDNKE